MFPYDPEILAIVRAVPQSVAQVLQDLQQIEALCADGDGLKWFNWLYLAVTQAVETRLGAGGFNDPAWLSELDLQFARLYFAALEASLANQATAGCWQVLFDRRSQAAIARIQFALAGINAHINHDLPQALVATCQAANTTPQYGGPQYRDYSALKATLDTVIDDAKRVLHVRLLGDPLPPVSHLEDLIAAWDITAAREAAWRNAELLWHLEWQPALASSFMDSLDGLTTVAGKALLVPVP